MRVFLRPAWAAPATVLLVLTMVFFGIRPARVIAAVQAFFGNLPGVGIVQNLQSAAVLTAPVSLEREGYTLTVENLVSSPERTWLRLRVDGWQPDPDYLFQYELQPAMPRLAAPGSNELNANQSDIYSGETLWAEYQFDALPAHAGTVTLILPQLPETLPGKAPENWQISLTLRAAQPKDALPAAASETHSSPMVNGIALSLLEISRSTEQTLLKVRLETPTLNAYQIPDIESHFSLTDAEGNILPLTLLNNNDRVITFKTRPFAEGAALSISLDQTLLVEDPMEPASAPSFVVQSGVNPAIGQHFTLDETLQSGVARLHVSGATLQAGEEGSLQLVFDVEPQAGIVRSLMFACADAACLGARSGQLRNDKSSPLHPSLQLKEMPARLTVTLASLTSSVSGPWQLDLTLAALPEELLRRAQIKPTASPTVVVTLTQAAPLRDEVAAQAALMLAENSAAFNHAGWVHLSTQYETNPEPGNYMSAETTQSERWYQLDEHGVIQRVLERLITPLGERQDHLTMGGYTYDFNSGSQLPGETLQCIDLTSPVIAYWRQLEAAGLPLYRGDANWMGQPALLISPLARLLIPDSRAEYEAVSAAAGDPLLVYIEPHTGQLLRWSRIQPVDGQDYWEDAQSFTVNTLESVATPPAGAAWLLKQVVRAPNGSGLLYQTPIAETPTEQLAAQVRDLLQKSFDALYGGQTGWVHTITQVEDRGPNESNI